MRSAPSALIDSASEMRRLGRTKAAITALTEALAQLEEGASRERGDALRMLGLALRDSGDIEGSVDAHTKAEYVFATLGDHAAQARERCTVGRVQLDQGHLREAQRAFVEILDARGTGADLGQILTAQAGLVEIRARRGDAGEAIDTLTAGIALAREGSLADAEVTCHAALAVVHGLLGDAKQSDEAYENAVRLMRHSGTHRAAAILHATVAERRAARGDVTNAREALRAAESVLGADRDKHIASLIALARGAIADATGDLTGALTSYWQAADIAQRGGIAVVERVACLLSGQLDPDQARAAGYLRRALVGLAAEADRSAFVLRPALGEWVRARLEQLAIPAEARAGVLELLTVQAQVEDAGAQAATGLQVTLLGGLDVRIGGQRISDRAWRTSKAKELFSLLLIHRDRALGRDEIIERLWPEADPASGISNFHFTLHALRKALASTKGENAPTVTTEGGYQLTKGQRSPLDIDVFTLLLQEANRFRRIGRNDDAVRLFRAGTAMYRGDLMTDLDSEWIEERREDLVRQFLSGLRQLAELELEREDGTAAAAACRKSLEREPYDEHVHRLLLRAYRASGDTALIERHYRSLVELLRSELGAQPERETTQVYEKLRGKGGLGALAPVRVTAR